LRFDRDTQHLQPLAVRHFAKTAGPWSKSANPVTQYIGGLRPVQPPVLFRQLAHVDGGGVILRMPLNRSGTNLFNRLHQQLCTRPCQYGL